MCSGSPKMMQSLHTLESGHPGCFGPDEQSAWGALPQFTRCIGFRIVTAYEIGKISDSTCCSREDGEQLDAMTMLRGLFIGLPALMVGLGIPLALKLVPPNRFYGFRTSTTFSSLDAWYQINFATGLAMIAAGIVGGLFALVLSYGLPAMKPEVRYLTGVLLTALVTAAFFIPVVIYSGKFGSDY
jgi:hypothetical protein